jgi:hypothetical protein
MIVLLLPLQNPAENESWGMLGSVVQEWNLKKFNINIYSYG